MRAGVAVCFALVEGRGYAAFGERQKEDEATRATTDGDTRWVVRGRHVECSYEVSSEDEWVG